MCEFNAEIDCESGDCQRCGWNPSVDRKRMVDRPTIRHIRCKHCGGIIETVIYGIGTFRKPCAHSLVGKDESPIPDFLWEMMMARMHLYYTAEEKTESGLLEDE